MVALQNRKKHRASLHLRLGLMPTAILLMSGALHVLSRKAVRCPDAPHWKLEGPRARKPKLNTVGPWL